MAKEAYSHGTSDHVAKVPRKHTRPAATRGTAIHMPKEAYSYGKSGLFVWQKSPILVAQEAYSYGKSSEENTQDLPRRWAHLFARLAFISRCSHV